MVSTLFLLIRQNKSCVNLYKIYIAMTYIITKLGVSWKEKALYVIRINTFF